MPCYDPRDDDERDKAKKLMQLLNIDLSSKSLNEIDSIANKIQLMAERCASLEAALCAVCNELDRREIAENVLSEASRNGLIDLMQFYSDHKKEDAARLANDIHKRYSKDELAVIKKLIDGQM